MTTFEKIFNAESIGFQTTKFFDELTNYYENFKSEKPIYSDLENIIKRNTNITVEIQDTGFWATSILMLGQNHVLFKDIFDQYKQWINLDTETDLKKLLSHEKKDVLKGHVDLNSSKVFGIFEKLKFTLWINSKDIKNNLSAQECAAITLHEVGHQFTTFEMLGNETYKNYALSNSLKAAGLDNSNVNKKVYLAKCAKDLNLDQEHSKTLVEAKNKEEAYLVILDDQRVSKELKNPFNSILKGNTYHTVNSEWAADDFATRQGAGEHVVTALNKMIDKSSSTRTLINVMSILSTFVLPIVLLGPGGLFLSMFLIMTNVIDAIEDQKHKRYDLDKHRFSRIKNTLILKLRTGDKLSKQQLEETLHSINTVENSINKVSSEQPSVVKVYSWIASLVSKDMKLSQKQEEFQKNLEQVTNNVLYEKAFKAKLASNK